MKENIKTIVLFVAAFAGIIVYFVGLCSILPWNTAENYLIVLIAMSLGGLLLNFVFLPHNFKELGKLFAIYAGLILAMILFCNHFMAIKTDIEDLGIHEFTALDYESEEGHTGYKRLQRTIEYYVIYAAKIDSGYMVKKSVHVSDADEMLKRVRNADMKEYRILYYNDSYHVVEMDITAEEYKSSMTQWQSKACSFGGDLGSLGLVIYLLAKFPEFKKKQGKTT